MSAELSRPQAPRLVLRADGNAIIGLGHLMRLLALAELLGPLFQETLFLLQAPTAPVQALLRNAGLVVAELPAGSLLNEVDSTLPQLLRLTDVLVLDGYNFDYPYQAAVRPLVARLVCLDDLHNFPFAADLVLNPAGGVSSAAYRFQVPGARLLSGPAYAPLRADFISASLTTASPHTVLLCLGGADPRQLTRSTATALLALPGVMHMHAVVGAAYAAWDELCTWAAQHAERLSLHRALAAPELAALMRQCGAAVLSPSTISYEYCAAGGGLLLLLPTAANQHDLDLFLRSEGLGLPYSTAPNVLTAAEAPRLAAQLQQAQHRYFDGQQGQRLRQEFAALLVPAAPFRLRLVQTADSTQLLTWTNDPATRQQSFHPAPVSLEQHETWLLNQLGHPERYLLLLAETIDTQEAVGLIRFAISALAQNQIPIATLSYSLGPAYRGRGWAAPLLLEGTRAVLAHWPQVTQVQGEVKANNVASVRAFQRAGFAEVKRSGPADSRTFAWVAVPVVQPQRPQTVLAQPFQPADS